MMMIRPKASLIAIAVAIGTSLPAIAATQGANRAFDTQSTAAGKPVDNTITQPATPDPENRANNGIAQREEQQNLSTRRAQSADRRNPAFDTPGKANGRVVGIPPSGDVPAARSGARSSAGPDNDAAFDTQTEANGHPVGNAASDDASRTTATGSAPSTVPNGNNRAFDNQTEANGRAVNK
jgi:hypothetical protein